jgi:dTDP-glucose 4,6-dehydratase
VAPVSAGSSFQPRHRLVTGGAGFIGSSVVRNVLSHSAPASRVEKLVVLDALTYAGHLANLEGDGITDDARFSFVQGDICDRDLLAKLFADHGIDSVLHLAAESHVDRSIESAAEFVRTNVDGTFALIDAAQRAWASATSPRRFVHVSTDEVYGALGVTGHFTEQTPYAPNSPYAASKAASDLLVRSFFKTYGLPTVITNTCNNYGPRQLPEKLLPLMITNAAEGKKLPVYGEGKQIYVPLIYLRAQFDFLPVTRFTIDLVTNEITEKRLVEDFEYDAPAKFSHIKETAGFGTYAPKAQSRE